MESEKRYKASTRGYIVDRTNADVMDTHEAADRLNALEAEGDRLRDALGEIEVIRGNWQDGTLDDVEAFTEISHWLSALYHNQALGGCDE